MRHGPLLTTILNSLTLIFLFLAAIFKVTDDKSPTSVVVTYWSLMILSLGLGIASNILKFIINSEKKRADKAIAEARHKYLNGRAYLLKQSLIENPRKTNIEQAIATLRASEKLFEYEDFEGPEILSIIIGLGLAYEKLSYADSTGGTILSATKSRLVIKNFRGRDDLTALPSTTLTNQIKVTKPLGLKQWSLAREEYHRGYKLFTREIAPAVKSKDLLNVGNNIGSFMLSDYYLHGNKESHLIAKECFKFIVWATEHDSERNTRASQKLSILDAIEIYRTYNLRK